jgi:predicted amidohydrolase
MDRTAVEIALGRVVLAGLVARGRTRVHVGSATAPAPMGWNRRQLVAAAVQWDMRPVGGLPEFTDRLTAVMDAAHHVGAALMVFPEDVGLCLLGLVTRYGGPRSAESLSASDASRYLSAWAPLVAPLYEECFRWAARNYGMVVVAGSSVYRRRSGVFNQAVVFGPDGRLVLRQPKLHPMPLERSWGVRPGSRLDRPGGLAMPLGIAVCHDASFFETYRMAGAQGAEVMAIPSADPDPDWSEAKARRGAWARSQETGMASVVAAGTGELYGVPFTGKAGLYIPRELSADGSGVVAESREAHGEGIVAGVLDLETLARFRQEARPAPAPELLRAWLLPRYRSLTTLT